MYTNGQNGYGPQVGQSPEGYPIYLYTDPRSRALSYVVVQPGGRTSYSDAQGKPVGRPYREVDAEVSGAMIAGAVGALRRPTLQSVVLGATKTQSAGRRRAT
jgi:hypothetical protein